MTLITVISLFLLLYRLPSKYGGACLLHPGLWYAVVWLLALLSYWALDAVDGVPIYAPEVLNELMVFLLLASWTFFVATFFSRKQRPKSVNENSIFVEKAPPQLTIFAVVGLLGALINWATLGANLAYDDSLRQQWLAEIPRITALMWYPYCLSFPAAMASGWMLGVTTRLGKKLKGRIRYVLMFPLVAGFFWSLGTGGRQALGMVLFHFVIGLSIGWVAESDKGIKMPFKQVRKIAFVLLGVLLALSTFVGLTGSARAKQQGNKPGNFDGVWWVAPIGQFITYTGLAIATHQAYGEPQRRLLSETGPVSLAGFQEFGLRYITGWRQVTWEDTNPERALASKGFALTSGTRNAFYDLQADFGFAGGLFAVLIMALISHGLFVFRPQLKTRRLLKITPLAMAIMYWGYSHQFSLLMFNTFFWLVVSCSIWDSFFLLLKPRPDNSPVFSSPRYS